MPNKVPEKFYVESNVKMGTPATEQLLKDS
jgi:hypothetical protein